MRIQEYCEIADDCFFQSIDGREWITFTAVIWEELNDHHKVNPVRIRATAFDDTALMIERFGREECGFVINGRLLSYGDAIGLIVDDVECDEIGVMN